MVVQSLPFEHFLSIDGMTAVSPGATPTNYATGFSYLSLGRMKGLFTLGPLHRKISQENHHDV
jgi:hypothetical protein